MKKIDIQNSLRERVKSTEWTDKDTWNVLDRIRATGKTREKHRLTFLVPAAAMLILAVCIGVTSIVNPGTPDLIRPTAHTVQPLANTQSGDSGSGDEITEAAVPTDEEAAVSSLRDCYPEIADALKPVNVVCEDQGIRVEIVSALVKDHSSWMLWTMQDLEGSRINESSVGIFNHPNNIGEVADYGYSYSYYNAEEKKLTVLEEIRYDSMNEPEDGMYLFAADGVYTHEYETVDLKPLLEKYKSVTEGVSPPSGAWPFYGVKDDPVPQDLKVLDYESPANVSLTGKGRLLLTGIGWVDGKLHVQIREADPAFCGIDDDGVSQVRNNGVFVTNCSAEGEPFGQSGDSPYVWEGSEGRWDEWLEFVFESTPDDEETMTLSAELVYTAKAAAGTWEFRIPVSAIRDGGDPAASGSVVLPVVDEADHFFLSFMYAENPDNLTPVGLSHEKDGIRMTVHSALVKGQEASVLLFVRDMESDRVNIDTSIQAGFADGTESGWEYTGCTTTEYDTENHIYAKLIKFSTEGDSDLREHTARLCFGDLNFYERTQTDLVPLVKQYTPADGEGIAEVDIPLHETVSLTGIGWVDGQLFMKFRGTSHEFPIMICEVPGADSGGNPVDENRLIQQTALPGDDSSSSNYETTMNVSPDEIDTMKLTVDFRNPTGTVEDNWEMMFPIKAVLEDGTGETAEENSPSPEEVVLEELRNVYPGIAEQLKPVNCTAEWNGIRLEIVSGLVRENESWILWTLQDLNGSKINNPTCELVEADDDIGKNEREDFFRSYCSPEEHKIAYLVQKHYDSMNEPYDDMYTFSVKGVLAHKSKETVDLIPLLERFGHAESGVEPPKSIIPNEGELSNAERKALNILNYTQPLDVPLDSENRVFLNNIGWISNRLHVQIREAEEAHIEKFQNMGYQSFYMGVYNYIQDGLRFGSDGGSPYEWTDGEDNGAIWTEYIFDSTPDDVSRMKLEISLNYQDFPVNGGWSVKVPVSLILADN